MPARGSMMVIDEPAVGHLEVLDPVTAGPEVAPLPAVQGLVDALPGPGDLLDGRVADGVDPHLKPGQVRAVEELGQLVVDEVAGAGPPVVGERLGEPRRPGPDRPVNGEVASDPAQAEVQNPADVGG